MEVAVLTLIAEHRNGDTVEKKDGELMKELMKIISDPLVNKRPWAEGISLY